MDKVKASRIPTHSSKSSKSDAATANIPCSINILEKDVSENPECYIMVQVSFFLVEVKKESGGPTHCRSKSNLQPHQQCKDRSLAR
jgi:hypothetical protein